MAAVSCFIEAIVLSDNDIRYNWATRCFSPRIRHPRSHADKMLQYETRFVSADRSSLCRCLACQPPLSQITRALSAGRFQFFQASGLTAGQSIFYKQQQTTLPSSWRLSTKPACVKQTFGSPSLIHVQPRSCKVFRTFHHAADGNVWGSWNGSKL